MLNGLDLFSGIGGLSLGLSPWVKPLAYCEKDQYCQAVLLSRMSDLQITRAPIWDDVTTLLPSMLPRQTIDIIYGGFPCQDISSAGNRDGLDGKRSQLYWELHRLVREVCPRWVFLENVQAIRTNGLLTVVRSLTDLGYDCRWTCVSASEIGAPHHRKRWFLLAYSDVKRLQSKRTKWKPEKDTEFTNSIWWKSQPNMGRVVYGVPIELDALIEGDDFEKNEQSYFEEAHTEVGFVKGQILRKMWIDREIAETSPELYYDDLRNIMPEMPQRSSHCRPFMGSWIKEGSELHDLWCGFYAAREQVEQAMWQAKLLVRIGEEKCRKAMETSNRVGRIKALGNAVVPAQATKAFKKLLDINGPEHNKPAYTPE